MKFSTKKTIATFLVLKNKVEFNVGAVVLIQMIVYWFNSCNIKEKCDSIHRTDELRTPRTLNSNSIIKLKKHPSTEVIPNCESSGTRRMKKLTTYIADAFKRPTKCNINTVRYLLENYLFSYVLSAMFSQDPLEKLFGQTRQRCGGNYFIDIVEIMAVMKMPFTSLFNMTCFQAHVIHMLNSQDPTKYKVNCVARYLQSNWWRCIRSTCFVKLSWVTESRWIALPTLSTVFFVQRGVNVQNFNTSPMSFANILLKHPVTANSNRAKPFDWLQRKKKLTSWIITSCSVQTVLLD